MKIYAHILEMSLEYVPLKACLSACLMTLGETQDSASDVARIYVI